MAADTGLLVVHLDLRLPTIVLKGLGFRGRYPVLATAEQCQKGFEVCWPACLTQLIFRNKKKVRSIIKLPMVSIVQGQEDWVLRLLNPVIQYWN